jgi:hypothetical protein
MQPDFLIHVIASLISSYFHRWPSDMSVTLGTQSSVSNIDTYPRVVCRAPQHNFCHAEWRFNVPLWRSDQIRDKIVHKVANADLRDQKPSDSTIVAEQIVKKFAHVSLVENPLRRQQCKYFASMCMWQYWTFPTVIKRAEARYAQAFRNKSHVDEKTFTCVEASNSSMLGMSPEAWEQNMSSWDLQYISNGVHLSQEKLESRLGVIPDVAVLYRVPSLRRLFRRSSGIYKMKETTCHERD